jgi:hypothetical protein
MRASIIIVVKGIAPLDPALHTNKLRKNTIAAITPIEKEEVGREKGNKLRI